MPRSYHHLGFYIKLGFVPGQLTYELSKFTQVTERQGGDSDDESFRCIAYSDVRKRSFLSKALAVTERAAPGTDYTKFIQASAQYSFGESLLFEKNSEPVALAVAHTAAYSLIEKHKLYRTCLLIVIDREPDKILSEIIHELENRARELGCVQIFFRLPASYWHASRLLLENRYKIVHSDLRMTLDGYPEVNNPGTLHFSRWE
jgi:hypothetical protein